MQSRTLSSAQQNITFVITYTATCFDCKLIIFKQLKIIFYIFENYLFQHSALQLLSYIINIVLVMNDNLTYIKKEYPKEKRKDIFGCDIPLTNLLVHYSSEVDF